MSRLSKAQMEVLTHMAKGHKLYIPRGGSTPWLNEVLGESGLYKRVHSNIAFALRDKGYIKKANTEDTPRWRRDYIITEEGRSQVEG